MITYGYQEAVGRHHCPADLSCAGAVNQVFLLKTGHSLLPIESGKLEPWITTGLTFAASAWSYWKNNSWTKEAINADEVMQLNKKNKR